MELFKKARKHKLKVQAVMSFHAGGGNVGDGSCDIPLPPWVLQVPLLPSKGSSITQDPYRQSVTDSLDTLFFQAGEEVEDEIFYSGENRLECILCLEPPNPPSGTGRKSSVSFWKKSTMTSL